MGNKWYRKSGCCRLFCLVLAAIFLGIPAGCTYESGGKEFQEAKAVEEKSFNDAEGVLEKSLNVALKKESSQKFWYTGWVANNVQKRRTTSMFNGVVVRPHGYMVNARLVGSPYRYYKWDDHYYIHTEDTGWERVEEEKFSLDPFAGLEWWEPLLERAVQLPNEQVLGQECRVLKVEVSGDEWLKESSSPLFLDLRETADAPGMTELLKASEVKMNLWIGVEDNLIYQYRTWIKMPVPSAGYMEQDIFFRFYKYNDPGIELKTPEEMEVEAAREKQD